MGISFDQGKTIYGFQPSVIALSEMTALGIDVLEFLKSGGAIRGQVYDDTEIFHRAHELSIVALARTHGWQVIRGVEDIEFERSFTDVEAQIQHGSPYPSWYRFPDMEGHPMPPQCENCATWPRKYVPILEETGQLRGYIPILEDKGFAGPD